MNAPGLPPEIWLQVMQEFAKRRDVASLFACARLSRGMANLALPLLWSVYELANVDISVVLWRSLIASALGKTAYPYCTWIKALRLSNLMSLLEDMGQQKKALKGPFFSPPLQDLKVLDREGVTIEVADLITKRIQADAQDADKSAQLLSLEGPHLPSARLSSFVSRLPRLTTLAVRDGSVLNGEVGMAIREGCPAFKELTCYYCNGADADTDLADFLRCLPSNTLESFTVNSVNSIGEATFRALTGHSVSLKRLGLMSLVPLAWESIDVLSTPNLESLALEADSRGRRMEPEMAENILLWLKQCVCLKELEMTSFSLTDTTDTILDDLLESPDMKLTSLVLQRWGASPRMCFRHLGTQTELRNLVITTIHDDDEVTLFSTAHNQLTSALTTQLHNLRHLATSWPFGIDQIRNIVQSNPYLEELVLNGYTFDNDEETFLDILKGLSYLKSIQIVSETTYEMDTIIDFLDALEADPAGDHEGFQLYMAQQEYAYRFTDTQEVVIDTEIKRRFGGRFTVNYTADPEELHESDFSD
ncbi:hypothetical protein B0T16DRAFT_458462 [Cercophora newfieldiana]|uniref:F-box domain-containing protein n=1 Tax=Cercophora newfieldiana TaxID=92897 RepID=A0AA39Y7Q1_9PEZI|nr:hypothetical protein B0T16DRAFT_458462 [Cercophora newfieldiana]